LLVTCTMYCTVLRSTAHNTHCLDSTRTLTRANMYVYAYTYIHSKLVWHFNVLHTFALDSPQRTLPRTHTHTGKRQYKIRIHIYVYIYIYLYIYIHIFLPIYVFTYLPIYILVCICILRYTILSLYTYLYALLRILYEHAHTHPHCYPPTLTSTHTSTHKPTLTYTQTHKHIHTYTFSQQQKYTSGIGRRCSGTGEHHATKWPIFLQKCTLRKFSNSASWPSRGRRTAGVFLHDDTKAPANATKATAPVIIKICHIRSFNVLEPPSICSL